MSNKVSVSLGSHFRAFIKDQVASGHFNSADEVVSAALRLLEEKEAKLDALSKALIEGEESGPADDFDCDDWSERRMRAPQRGEAA